MIFRNREPGSLWHILILSISFTCIMGAVRSTFMAGKIILENAKSTSSSFGADGYISMCIFYGVYGISTWLAPSLIAVLNSKNCMIIGGILYIGYIAAFLYPLTWLIYLFSALIGIAGAILWTSQGSYFTTISTRSTVSRNSGIFSAMSEGSILIGSGFMYFKFNGKMYIDEETRFITIGVMVLFGIFGILSLFALQDPNKFENENKKISSMTSAFKDACKLLTTPNILLLSLTFINTGHLSFYSRLYASAIGFTLNLGNEAKALVASVGIFLGIGELIGGFTFGALGSKITCKGRWPLFTFGSILCITCYILIFLNLPNTANNSETLDVSYFNPPIPYVTTITSFLMGLGDSCIQTQLAATMSSLFKSSAAPAFAIFRFMQAATACVLFFTGSLVGLHFHTLLISIGSVLATITFIIVELKNKDLLKESIANVTESSSES